MNYLAHIFLAAHSPQAMLGALLGDFVKGRVDGLFTPEIETEILLHRKIDVYTDQHRLVRSAADLLQGKSRRYAGIVLDVYFDHLLARNWGQYCDEPLSPWLARFYRHVQQMQEILPPPLQERVPEMCAGDWLGAYQRRAGVEQALARIAQRMPTAAQHLTDGLQLLYAQDQLVHTIFVDFFADLQNWVPAQRQLLSRGPDKCRQ